MEHEPDVAICFEVKTLVLHSNGIKIREIDPESR